MKATFACLILFSALLFTSCEVMISGTDYNEDIEWEEEEQEQEEEEETPKQISFKTTTLFPFQNNTNWWKYSEAGGNSMTIEVTDTISDDNVLYYRVSFKEHRVDTTDDWFQQSSAGTLFGPSLIGSYHLFLPARIDSESDTFSSNNSNVTYTWYESIKCDAGRFNNAVKLRYNHPIIHGFDEIILADSIGIVHLTDFDARWTVDYSLDSCSIEGSVRYFKGHGEE
jgi:hypothetical protein